MNRELYHSRLLKQFHEFYREVIVQKSNVDRYAEKYQLNDVSKSRKAEVESTDDKIPETTETDKTGALPEASNSEKALETPEIDVNSFHKISSNLLKILEKQVLEARRQGGEYGVAFYKEAQYVMASLADEIFLNMKWDGKETWKSNLLEFKLFGTYVAGELFFQKVDKLLKDRDPAYTEMAAVYFLALSLGFKGKYRDIDDNGLLAHHQKQLFNFIFKKDPGMLSKTKNLFPETYKHTLIQGNDEKLPYIRWWIGLIVLLILLFFIASHFIWIHSTKELLQIVETILNKFAIF